ncbi:hypothetical protein K469DRAFT_673970 [Zopfia rhizophila CBS 207.26]|uniref:P-loop containing nucleoside triphosphate hydrolase protein n=1 Tax=Zopfia rhizophila CBS 207.26 TaxID=1314779 RepID=A0A6A6DPJ0_9PEZI|nr:hypothetical protein K469DRAFT_673970 [Zopfia rhizophila CBS 207.26]
MQEGLESPTFVDSQEEPQNDYAQNDPTALDQLLSADQSEILELIDSLRHGNLEQYNIELPQIIVCGDQSCGKSSVLEAISRLNFPHGQGLSTTFATELTLRRGSTRGAAVGILSKNPEHGFVRLPPLSESVSDFGATIAKVNNILHERYNPDRKKPFFDDVLQIEVWNPSWPPLTLVDLPGFISGLNEGQNENDKAMAEQIAAGYMKKSKTIILAVVSASHDIATQQALSLAKKYDPDGSRTMGIITKPDRIEGSEGLMDFIRLAKNKSEHYQLDLGWHVVRNPGPKDTERTFDQRDQREQEYFNEKEPIWKRKLELEQLGISALRTRLSKILEESSREELPKIRRKLNTKYKDCVKQLRDLGPPRSTLAEQEHYISRISEEFEELIKQATTGRYENENFFREFQTRFRAWLIHENGKFARSMYKWGHDFEDEALQATARGSAPSIIQANGRPGVRQLPQGMSRDEIIEKKVRHVQMWNQSSGVPGTFQPRCVTKVFQDKARPWRSIAEAHILTVWGAARNLFYRAGKAAARNKHTADAICEYLIDIELVKKREEMRKKLDEVLRPYTEIEATTYNPEFMVKRERRREHKNRTEDESLRQILTGKQRNADYLQQIEHGLAQYRHPRVEFATDSSEILDLADTYYEIALPTFIDNVANLVIESCLVHDLHLMFKPTTVQQMSREDAQNLAALASEPQKIYHKRKRLEKEERDLSKALEECKNKLGDSGILEIPDLSEFDHFEEFFRLRGDPSPSLESPLDRSEELPRPPRPTSRLAHSRSSSSLSIQSEATGLTVPARGSVANRGPEHNFQEVHARKGALSPSSILSKSLPRKSLLTTPSADSYQVKSLNLSDDDDDEL